MFRTWTIRQGNTVWVRKLTEIVISLWLGIIKLDKELFNVILLYGNILETNIWNKWGYESVNKWLTFIKHSRDRGKEERNRTLQQQTTDKYHLYR